MTEAWVKRGAERQELLRELMQKVHNIEEAAPGENMHGGERIEFELDLIQAIAANLKQKVHPQDLPAVDTDIASSFFFRDDILSRVRGFSRAEEESDWLFLELMNKLMESVGFYFHNRLMKLEHSNPQQIFRAPSAMAEVPLNS
jgi:hypothetical protein